MATGYHDFTAGETLTAANLEDYCELQSVMQFADSATRDTALSAVKTEGTQSLQRDSNSVTVYSGSAWSTVGPLYGALTSWTPTVTQSGSVTVTVNYATYQRIGRLIHAQFKCTVTGSGTGANAIIIGGLPATAQATASAFPIGVGNVFDTSAGNHFPGIMFLASTTTLDFRSTQSNLTDPRLGITQMSAGLAVGDIVSGDFKYEAGSDA